MYVYIYVYVHTCIYTYYIEIHTPIHVGIHSYMRKTKIKKGYLQCMNRYIYESVINDKTVRKTWVQQILKGRKDLKSESDIPNNCFVCSNHFLDA